MDDEDFGLGEEEAEQDLNSRVDDLKQAFVNEKAAPELLPFEDEVVEELLKSVHEQQRIIDDGGANASEKFAISMYQMEIDRIKFLLSSYLRTRVGKVERFPRFVLQDEDLRSRLSAQELDFAKKLVELNDAHAHRLVLSHVPERTRSLDQQGKEVDMVPRPDLDVYVCCNVQDDVGTVEDEARGPSVPLQRGSRLIVRYAVVRRFVAEGRVALL